MKKTLSELTRNEKGIALVIVLCLLAFSGLVIAPLLAYIATGVNAGKTQENRMALIYAADAGTEDAIWRTNNEEIPLEPFDYETEYTYSLPQDINGKAVSVTVKQIWPLSGLESEANGTTPHSCLVSTGGVTDAQTGEYEVHFSYDGSMGNISIDRVGVWLAPGFEYVTGSSSGITTEDPSEVDSHGGKALLWDFDPPGDFLDLPHEEQEPLPGGFTPAVEYPATRVLQFLVSPTGEEPPVSCPWIRTTRSDIYLSWDTDCTIYKITSTATDSATGKSTTVESYTYLGEGGEGWIGGGASSITGDYRAIGNTMMEDTDSDRRRETFYDESSATISDIPTDAEVAFAYLYWSGWREGGEMEADTDIGLKINGQSVYFDDQGEPALGEPDLQPEPATEILRPNSSGSYTQCYRYGDWPNYECVDEAVADDSSTFVYSKYGYTKMDTYNIQNSSGSGTITSVTIHARARAYYYYSCADMGMQIVARTHSTNYYSDEFTLIGNAGWGDYSETWTTNPYTGEPWTWDEIDDLQIGVKLYDYGPGYPDCTQVYAEVNYETVPLFQGITASKWYLVENDPPGYAYSCFRDVTELVKLVTTTGNATYTAIGVEGDTDDEWSYAAWSLIIIYSSPSEQAQQFYLYDNMLYSGMDSSHTFTIEGFQAPDNPQSTLTCFVGEGDEFYSGDYLQFNDYYLSDAINPQDNVWNGKSSHLGGEIIDGVDIDTFNVSSPIIQSGDTSAEVKLTTGTDSWNLIYIILAFRSEVSGLMPNSTGIITYSYTSGP